MLRSTAALRGLEVKVTKLDLLKPEEVGHLFGLLVHDLRNPAATISANADFLQEVGISDGEAGEALDDVQIAVGQLRRGLDLVAWISRWLLGQAPLESAPGDAGVFLRRLEHEETPVPVKIEIEQNGSLYALGAQAAVEILRTLLHNTKQHARDTTAELRVYRDKDDVVLELKDEGAALGQELRELAFTLKGQKQLKGRADGRYGRFAGMLGVAVAAQGIGARVEADGVDGASVFRIRLRPSAPTTPPRPSKV